jgi:hypothetical protein
MARRYLAGTCVGAAVVALLIGARADCQASPEAAVDTNPWESRADTRAALLAAGDADSLEAAAFLTPPRLSAERGANRYLGLLASHRTEQEVLVAELVAKGIDPRPPAGWTEPAL